MTQATIYIGGNLDYLSLKGLRKAILDFGQANNLGELRSENYTEETVPGPALRECIQNAQPNSVFVVNSLAAFGTKPSEQRERIHTLLGKQVDVFILGLGPVANFLHILRACWAAGMELEREMAQMQADYDAHERALADEKQKFEDRLVSRMSEVMGHGSVKAFYSNGGPHEAEPAVTPEPAEGWKPETETKWIAR
jgi:hypothetical protein